MVAGFTYKDAFILLMYEDEVYKRSVGTERFVSTNLI